jgi:hypothetical protein
MKTTSTKCHRHLDGNYGGFYSPLMSKVKIILTASIGWILAGFSSAQGEEKFIVHEWGVQVIGKVDGNQVLTAPAELLDGLPKFVVRNLRPVSFEAHGWDKPVIHLYGKEGMEVSVEVATPTGVPLAYYPLPVIGKGEMVGYSREVMMQGMFHFDDGLEWRGELCRDQPDNLAALRPRHWWNVARSIPSSYIETEAGSERFLFYEATAEQKPVIRAGIAFGQIELSNSYKEAVGPVVILVNDGTGVRGLMRSEISTGKPTKIADKEFSDWSVETILKNCRKQWKALGMTDAESFAIVEIWKKDLVNRLGVLVISPMPRELYDAMFPITIDPQPDELVRAGIVFDTLPGQESCSVWLPGLAEHLRKLGPLLTSVEYAERSAAEFAFLSAGDLATEILNELAESKEPNLRVKVRQMQQKSRTDLGIEFQRPRNLDHAAKMVKEFLDSDIGMRRLRKEEK